MNAIFKKELSVYFRSFVGYFFLFILVALSAFFFMANCVFYNSPYYNYVLSSMTIVFLILIPTLTMRLFAEEARQKTDQLLYTAPVTVPQIVIGKFLASMCLFLIGMAITALFPLILSRFGEMPAAQIVSAYLGYILMGGCFIAIGMFISIFTDNQIISAVATFAVLLLMFFLQNIIPSLPVGTGYAIGFVALLIVLLAVLVYDGTKNIPVTVIVAVVCFAALIATALFKASLFDGFIVKALMWISILSRFDNFNKGILNVSDIIYYLSFIVLFLFFTANTIEKRRWR